MGAGHTPCEEGQRPGEVAGHHQQASAPLRPPCAEWGAPFSCQVVSGALVGSGTNVTAC